MDPESPEYNSLSLGNSSQKCSTNLYASVATTITHEPGPPEIPLFPLRTFDRNNFAQEFYYRRKI